MYWIRYVPYVCSDVVEFGDESMFNDVNGNFRGDDHKNIREQNPQVVWGEKWKYFLQFMHMLNNPSLDSVYILSTYQVLRYNLYLL